MGEILIDYDNLKAEVESCFTKEGALNADQYASIIINKGSARQEVFKAMLDVEIRKRAGEREIVRKQEKTTTITIRFSKGGRGRRPNWMKKTYSVEVDTEEPNKKLGKFVEENNLPLKVTGWNL